MSLLSITLYIFLFIAHASGKLIQAAEGDDVKFALTEECKHGTGSLQHESMNQLVASLINGVWKPGPAYGNRVNQSGDSVILRSVDFNDQGHYAFTCNDKLKEELDELHVFLPSNFTVLQGQDATLTCRSMTAGQLTFVRWRRNGEVVLQVDVRSGQITYGNGYDETRVSIPRDWRRRGVMSLTIKSAEVTDGGIYYCDLDNTEKHRSAVRLQVLRRASSPPPDTPSQTTTAPPPQVSPLWSWPTFGITAAAAAAVFVIAGLLAWLAWYLRCRNFSVCARPGDVEASQHDDIPLRTTSMSSGCGALCKSPDDEGDEEDGDSDGGQQNMLKSNGHH